MHLLQGANWISGQCAYRFVDLYGIICAIWRMGRWHVVEESDEWLLQRQERGVHNFRVLPTNSKNPRNLVGR
jgi:hypothetical protein